MNVEPLISEISIGCVFEILDPFIDPAQVRRDQVEGRWE